MPLYLTGAHSSRITKPRVLKRTSSLPFTSTKRAQTLERAHTVATADNGDKTEVDELLSRPGKVVTVIDSDCSDVLSALQHARHIMFDDLPERAGMNSIRIAKVLNFQRNLPAVVSRAHIHALRSASSEIEKDIQTLLAGNVVRRLRLVGRGNEISGLNELLISTQAYETAVRSSNVSNDVISSFFSALKTYPRGYSLPSRSLPRPHAEILVRAGFLVAPSISSCRDSAARFSQSVVAPAAISRSASGSKAAVGGDSAFETLGGVNGIRRPKSEASLVSGADHVLSVPGIAAYLQLLDAGRSHLLDLLRQSSKHKHAPIYLLKERWNGNVDDDNSQISIARRIRGDFSNVLPAKTKKWRTLHGLSFDWILEECLGAGLIELFETYSVGLGVRSLV